MSVELWTKICEKTGLTDGDGIERLWSSLRKYSRITKEMSLNNRHDLLTEGLLHHTNKVIWTIGTKMEKKYIKAKKVIEMNTTVLNEHADQMQDSPQSSFLRNGNPIMTRKHNKLTNFLIKNFFVKS